MLCILRAVESWRVASLVHHTGQTEQELSYRKQIARKLRTEYVECI